MSARLTRIFESNPLEAPVPPDLKALVALAVKVTARPEDVDPEEIRVAFSAAQSPRQYFDAVGVMIAFNFITRVANALGVEPEIPSWMRRFEPLRQLGLRAMGLFFRLFVSLDKKGVHGPDPGEHLAALQIVFSDLRLGELPGWIERLTFAPPLLAALREFLEALMRRDKATGCIGLDPNQFMAIGKTVLQTIPNAQTLNTLVDNWEADSPGEENEERTALIRRFANDVTLRSYTLTQERIDELRAANLDDTEILDVVVTAALWGAAARLEVLTSCLPVLVPQEVNDQQQLYADALFPAQAST